jgi:H+-transporting ATPase
VYFSVLIGAGLIALIISTMLATFWPESNPDNIETLGLGLASPKLMSLYIWLYCLFWWLVQDAAKVWFHTQMSARNWFGYLNTGKLELPESALQWRAAHEHDDPTTAQ